MDKAMLKNGNDLTNAKRTPSGSGSNKKVPKRQDDANDTCGCLIF
jgi:hypothetical protein